MKKILVIEDNKDVRENTADILEFANYEVMTAENGKIGVEMAKQYRTKAEFKFHNQRSCYKRNDEYLQVFIL